MARYDSGIYGVSTYDANATTTVDITSASITATQTSTTGVRVIWQIPSTSMQAWVVCRSTLGTPTDPVSGQAVNLVTVDATNSADPNTSLRALTDSVDEGSEVFYALFIQVIDSTDPNTYRWVLAAQAYLAMVIDHDTFNRLRRSIPAAFTTTDGSEIGGAADAAEPLSVILTSFADYFDEILSDADRVLKIWNPHKTPVKLIAALAQMLGMPIEPHLGPKAQRALSANAATIVLDKGTSTGVETLATCLTGRQTTIESGKNLFPSAGTAAYEQQFVLTTTLATAITSTGQTSVQVASVDGWPIRRSPGSVTPKTRLLMTVRNGTTVEVMHVTAAEGTALTVVRGVNGTDAASAFSIGSAVTLQLTNDYWDCTPGYDTDIVDSSGAGFAMPTATGTSTDQPPLQAHCLKITSISSSVNLVVPELSFSGLRWVAAYSRTNGIGTVTTCRPHGLDVGSAISGFFASVAVSSGNASKYNVLSVTDPYTFTILHTDSSGTSSMPSTDVVSATPPYIIGLPTAANVISVTAADTYSYSVQVRAGSTSRNVKAQITWLDHWGNTLSTSAGTSTGDASGSWTSVSVSDTAPATAVFAAPSLQWQSGAWASGESHYVTQHQLELAASPTGYDDGGLVRVGINAPATIDPTKTIRLRTRTLLPDFAPDDRIYRVEFLDRSATFPTSTSSATLLHDAVTWGDFDIRIRLNPTSLASTQTVIASYDALSELQWKFEITTTALALIVNTTGSLNTYTSSAAGLTAGQNVWLRVTRVASTGVITFFKSADSSQEPYVWTQISQTTGVTGNTHTNGTETVIGTVASAGFLGSLFILRTLVGTADVASFDPWLYDSVRNVVSNRGTIVADWGLSTGSDAITISTTYP